MCGICGVIKARGGRPEEALLRRMIHSMRHRGPDGQGVYMEGEVGLGHARLAILDLSARGAQPMGYAGRYTITYNGEVYNYRELREQLRGMGYDFCSDTDTEVICAAYDAWGADCLSRLNGMWAFALFDSKEREVFLARDRFGVKPLYYCITDGDFLFASEIKSILEDERVRREVNLDLAQDYLAQGLLDHTNETFFRGIGKLPQGCYMYVRAGEADAPLRYYTPTFSKETRGELRQAQVEQFAELFADSVRLRLRADVPVGSCLSGGLDSSAIVCGMRRLAREEGLGMAQHTFSMCPADERLSERRYIDDVLAYTGAEGHFVTPTCEELLADLPGLVRCQEEPFGSTSIYASYRVMRLARENQVPVLLDGQGADEILCGYRKSRLYYVSQLWQQKQVGRALWEAAMSVSQARTSFQRQNDIQKAKRILRRGKAAQEQRDPYLREEMNGHGYDYDRTQDFQYNDLMVISLPALLRYADKNAMAHSVESRLPFLDVRVVELLAALPLNAKIKNGYSKYIMRQALEMPESVRRRKDKMGFITPEQAWLAQGREALQAAFREAAPAAEGILDTGRILEDWEEIERQNAIRLWRYILLALWMREYRVELA